MSANEIFAAQMWAWPGPMLKRDASGRVLLVNAAFLQMYGGRVEDWHGNTVAGWPAPQGPGTSTRFESRLPLPDGQELIYDWLECVMADGSALTIARDVTAIVAAASTQPAAPQTFTTPPVQSAPQATQAPEVTPPPPAQASAPLHTQETAAPAAPAYEPPVTQAPVSPPPNLAQPTPPVAQAPQTPAEPVAAPVEQVPTAPEANTAPPSLPPPPEPKRDFERRALPIENGDAVLGNNWRDAVIAKAVGVEDPSEIRKEEAETMPEPVVEQKGPAVRILLAEDNAINALLTRTLLEAEGCIVDVVEDGLLAVDAVKNAPYDMIFMDMRMPNMDGLEATRKIRSMQHASKGLPIVALTANAFDDDRNACFDSGMNDFMTKPVSAEELSQMVKTHTGYENERMAG